MSRRGLLPILLLVLGCPRAAETLPSGETQVIAVQGLEVRVLPRDTAGLVHVALFVDAGSRHASPPSAATIASWSAAGELEARATPDFVWFSTDCAVDVLREALDSMAATLNAPEIDPEKHAELVARWEDARRRSIAQPSRRADTLAMTALHGPGFDPLDGEVATLAQTRAFLADHFGRSRALLVIVGDVEPEDAERLVRDAFRDVPRARAGRPTASVPEPTPSKREDGTSTHATVAVDFPATHRAYALGHRAHAMGLAQSATVYPHAQGTTLLLRTRDLGTLPSLRWMAAHAYGHDHPLGEALSPAKEAERLALRWRREPAASEVRRVSLGLVCEAECDVNGPQPLPEARVEGARATVTLPNGAEVIAIRRRAENVAWSVHLDSGGQSHGEVVVLAHALARRCGGQVRLDERGFSLNGSGPRWRRELRATLDCMTPDIANVAQDWTGVLDGLRVAPERGWIAGALSPGLTSRVAPGGRLHEVAESARAAARWSRLRVGSRARVAIVGNVQPQRAVHAIPVLGVWPRGEAPRAMRWGDSVPMAPAEWDDVARVVVGWRTDAGGGAAEVAARAFARTAAEQLHRHGAVLWHDGDGGAWGAWAAVALDVDAETLDAIRAIVDRMAVEQSLEGNLRDEAERARWRAGDLQEVAWRAARGVPIEVVGDPAPTLEALRTATPVLAIGRPQNDTALRRWRRVTAP